MNRFQFDDLTRALAAAADSRTTRRSLLRMLGVGGAAGLATSVTGGNALAAFQDAPATPAPQVPVQPPIDVITVAQKASELLYDVDAIFEYVANEVHYEAYSGALRGDRGTLWSMAGNSVDQSLLLAALLKESLFDIRFAVGSLDDATSQQLVDSMLLDHDALLDQDLRAQFANASVNGTSALMATPETTSSQSSTLQVQIPQEELDAATAAKDAQVAEAKTQLAASVKVITDALASSNITLPDPATPKLPDRERQQHVWVQYASGSDWIDLDPSMPNAEAGQAYGTVAETMAELPAELDHLVRFRVVKEVVSGGAPLQQDVVVSEHKARDLVGVPIAFAHLDPSNFEGLGLAISGVLEGTTNFIPTFFVGRDALSADQPLQFGSGGGFLDDLGGEESNEGDTLAEWLITEITTPDGAIAPIEREIFDRVGYENRAAALAAGTPLDVSPAAVPAIELIDVGEGSPAYPPMMEIVGLAVIGSQVPSWLLDPARLNVDDMTNMLIGIHGYHLVRDRLSLESLAPKGYRYYNDGPNVTAFFYRPVDVTEGQTPEFTIAADLIHRSVAHVPVTGAEAGTNAEVLAGVIAHVAERIALETTDWAADFEPDQPAGPPPLSVGRLFEEAATQQIASAVLQSGAIEADLSALSVSPQASSRIKAALDAGYVVIVPEKSVTIAGEPISGWWQIDPTTGFTQDRLENGQGAVILKSANLLGPMVEYTELLIELAWRLRVGYKRLGCVIAVAALISGALWTTSAFQAGFSGSGTYANAGAAIAAGIGGGLGIFARGACFY